MQVIAAKKHRYGGKARQPNEPYEARDGHVKFLASMGWVKPKAEPDPVAPAAPVRQAPTQPTQQAEEPIAKHSVMTTSDFDPETTPGKRKYKRRDMVPEE